VYAEEASCPHLNADGHDMGVHIYINPFRPMKEIDSIGRKKNKGEKKMSDEQNVCFRDYSLFLNETNHHPSNANTKAPNGIPLVSCNRGNVFSFNRRLRATPIRSPKWVLERRDWRKCGLVWR
jgi:hypothetical protein